MAKIGLPGSEFPRISVIIPAYNAEETLPETIESVRKQTFTDFEIIVINDGSTDSTAELVAAIPDERIRLFSDENGGLATARNRGLRRSRGHLITFLDADDLWTPDKLEAQYQALQDDPIAGAVYSWTLVMDDATGRLNPGIAASFSGDVYEQLYRGNFIASGSNLMLRRSVFEATGFFSLRAKGVEDWEYWLRIARNYRFTAVPEFQVLYRQAVQTMSSDVGKMKHNLLKVHEQEFQAAPRLLRAVKGPSLAYIYRYAAKLSLDRTSGLKGLLSTGRDLGVAIANSPRILLETQTQKLLAKWLLTGLLPTHLSGALFERISQLGSVQLMLQPSLESPSST